MENDEEMMERLTQWERKLEKKERKLKKREKKGPKYTGYVQTLRCNGQKCHIHVEHGTGMHCESCFRPYEEEDLYGITLHVPSGINTIWCGGNKCRLHGDNGAFHCESCFGPYKEKKGKKGKKDDDDWS